MPQFHYPKWTGDHGMLIVRGEKEIPSINNGVFVDGLRQTAILSMKQGLFVDGIYQKYLRRLQCPLSARIRSEKLGNISSLPHDANTAVAAITVNMGFFIL